MEPRSDRQHSMEINEEIFNHLVDLAAFHLEREDGDYLRRELNNQLKAIRELEAIEIDDNVPITSHGVPYSQAIRLPLRQDSIEPSTRADDIIQQSPDVNERYIIVPDIPHEELS